MNRKDVGHWKLKSNRILAVRNLVKKLNIPASCITQKHFTENSLTYIFRYKKGVFNALLEAGFKPGKKRFPIGYWKIKRNRIKHTIKLCNKLDKKPNDIIKSDFNTNHLSGLSLTVKSVKKALEEAGYSDIKEPKPAGYWGIKKNRIIAIRDFVKKCNKEIYEITNKDFKKYGIGTVLNYYNNQQWRALQDAGYRIEPWELKNLPLNFWASSKNRKEAIKWLLKTTKKKPEELVAKDFMSRGMKQLIVQFGGVYKSLRNAGFKIGRKRLPNGYWGDRTTRINKIRDLVEKTHKHPNEVIVTDFIENKLLGLLRYYNDSAIGALRDAGYTISQEVSQRRKILPGRKKVYISNHGHKFCSIFERDIDDWLWNKGIREHQHNMLYPNSKSNCDFVIGSFWIEATGLMSMKWYRDKIQFKKDLAKRYNINLITISIEEFRKKHILESKLANVLKEYGKSYNKPLTEFGLV